MAERDIRKYINNGVDTGTLSILSTRGVFAEEVIPANVDEMLDYFRLRNPSMTLEGDRKLRMSILSTESFWALRIWGSVAGYLTANMEVDKNVLNRLGASEGSVARLSWLLPTVKEIAWYYGEQEFSKPWKACNVASHLHKVFLVTEESLRRKGYRSSLIIGNKQEDTSNWPLYIPKDYKPVWPFPQFRDKPGQVVYYLKKLMK